MSPTLRRARALSGLTAFGDAALAVTWSFPTFSSYFTKNEAAVQTHPASRDKE